MDWESFYKWLQGKLWFQLFIVGITAGLIIIAKIMMGGSSSQSAQTAKKGRMYATPPSVCYCHSCGATIQMTGELAGKHCREITCPYCGSRNVWRSPPT